MKARETQVEFSRLNTTLNWEKIDEECQLGLEVLPQSHPMGGNSRSNATAFV